MKHPFGIDLVEAIKSISQPNRWERIETSLVVFIQSLNLRISQPNRWERIETGYVDDNGIDSVCISQPNRWERIETLSTEKKVIRITHLPA